MTINLKSKERLDDLGINDFHIIQNPDLFCFGIDAVLLSDFAKVKEGQNVLDLCTGTGILPILLAAKTKAGTLKGIEIQEESVDMAKRSVQYNGIEDRVEIKQGDVKEADKLFLQDSFDVITCNPPYMLCDHGFQNPGEAKAIARHEVLLNFDDVARVTSKLLKNAGEFYLVHRPFRLVELLDTLTKYHLEPKDIRFVHSYADKEPSMVLIHCKKGAKRYVKVEKPLIIYEKENVYTQEVLEIYHME